VTQINTVKRMTTPNSQRPKGARNKVLRAEQQQRREEAAVRAAEHAQLTPQQKLAKLDQRLGMGVGALKERSRILAQIQAGKTEPLPKATAEAIFNKDEAKGGAKKRGAKSGKGTKRASNEN
jgi:hypothetical protein